MIVKRFTVDSSEYPLSLVLRQAVLREPLGLQLSEEDLQGEAQQLHFGIFEQMQIQAVVLFKPVTEDTLKLRQMAVSLQQQGKGLGKRLIQQAELEVVKLGYKKVEMAARESAIPFYQSLGYQVASEAFEEVGITHIKMAKSL